MVNIGRKFTSQTSDNMDRWKSRGGKRQRSEEKKREDQRRKGIRCEKEEEKGSEKKKEDAGARKGRKAPIHCVFPMVCVAPDGRKVGSLKRQMRSHLAR